MLLFLTISLVSSWDYFESGHDWQGACASNLIQTPINLDLQGHSVKLSSEGFIFLSSDDVTSTATVAPGVYKITAPFGFSYIFLPKTDPVIGEIANVHFHSPAENMLNGKRYSLEMHIVMDDMAGKYSHVVLGVWFNVGRCRNAFVDKAMAAKGENVEISLRDLFTDEYVANFYMFLGSLTTPPCTDGALWLLVDRPLSITSDQLQFFTDMWEGNTDFAGGNGNNREIQQVNGRNVIHFYHFESIDNPCLLH
jgi:hypothetical protein